GGTYRAVGSTLQPAGRDRSKSAKSFGLFVARALLYPRPTAMLTRRNRMRVLKLLLAFPLIGLACTSPDTPPADQVSDQTLAASYGGQTTSAELPEFGDPTLQTPVFADDDPVAGDTASTTDPTLTGAERIRILVAWGYVKPHPDATEVVD